jgi:hypothetical protein
MRQMPGHFTSCVLIVIASADDFLDVGSKQDSLGSVSNVQLDPSLLICLHAQIGQCMSPSYQQGEGNPRQRQS